MIQILKVYRSNWPIALAAGAYKAIAEDKVEYLDKYEEKGDLEELNSLYNELRLVNREKDWTEPIGFLIHQIGMAYLLERNDRRLARPGLEMTLIGHSSNHFIEMGFLGMIASSLDNSSTEQNYRRYVPIEKTIRSAFNTGDTGVLPQLFADRSTALSTLEEYYSILVAKIEE
jgi:hypothetical protein